MRLLRWAADLAAADDVRRRAVGVAALDALDDLPILHADDQVLITAVLHAVTAEEDTQYGSGDVVEESWVPKLIEVGRAQIAAAKLIVKRADQMGIGTASPAIRATAAARPPRPRDDSPGACDDESTAGPA